MAWLFFAVVFAATRFCVPTALDVSPTSLYKDAAHIFVGMLLWRTCEDVREQRRADWQLSGWSATVNSPFAQTLAALTAVEILAASVAR